jgi:hypothetical protein
MSWPSPMCSSFPAKVPRRDSRRDEKLGIVFSISSKCPQAQACSLILKKIIKSYMLGLLSINSNFLCIYMHNRNKRRQVHRSRAELIRSYQPVNCNYERIYPHRPAAIGGHGLKDGHLTFSWS